MTEQTPDPALVELVELAMVDSTCDCDPRWLSCVRCDARDVLSALTADGYQVLPPGGRREWTVAVDGRPVRSYAHLLTEDSARNIARNDPDGNVTVVSRLTGPWQPDTEETPDA